MSLQARQHVLRYRVDSTSKDGASTEQNAETATISLPPEQKVEEVAVGEPET